MGGPSLADFREARVEFALNAVHANGSVRLTRLVSVKWVDHRHDVCDLVDVELPERLTDQGWGAQAIETASRTPSEAIEEPRSRCEGHHLERADQITLNACLDRPRERPMDDSAR